MTSTSLCAASSARIAVVVFLGPTNFIGTAGGGIEIQHVRVHGDGFTATFVIPRTNLASGDDRHFAPVKPGTYRFATYPAAGCVVSFKIK